jgi:hypothetical protein
VLERQLERIDDLRTQRGLTEGSARPLPFGDGEGEAQRRSLGDIRTWSSAEAG